jgi:hypothetical protein
VCSAAGRTGPALAPRWTSRGDRDEERTVLTDVASGPAELAWVGTRPSACFLASTRLSPCTLRFCSRVDRRFDESSFLGSWRRY